MRRNHLFRLIAIAAALSILKMPAQMAAESAVPVDLEVPAPPVPVKADGKMHLFYELHVSNFRPGTLELKRLEVLVDGNRVASIC